MLVGVVYNTASTMIMSLAFSENATEDANLQNGLLPLGGKVPENQSIAVVTLQTVHSSVTDVIAAAQAQLSLSLQPPVQCAIVDPAQNVVVDMVMADPNDNPFSGRLVFACAAAIGWTYNPVARTLTEPGINPSVVSVGAAVGPSL